MFFAEYNAMSCGKEKERAALFNPEAQARRHYCHDEFLASNKILKQVDTDSMVDLDCKNDRLRLRKAVVAIGVSSLGFGISEKALLRRPFIQFF
jgi:hypothetical protein